VSRCNTVLAGRQLVGVSSNQACIHMLASFIDLAVDSASDMHCIIGGQSTKQTLAWEESFCSRRRSRSAAVVYDEASPPAESLPYGVFLPVALNDD
jgi:hypothetical protein